MYCGCLLCRVFGEEKEKGGDSSNADETNI